MFITILHHYHYHYSIINMAMMTGGSTTAMSSNNDNSSRYAYNSGYVDTSERLSPPSPPDYRDVMAARNGYGALMVTDMWGRHGALACGANNSHIHSHGSSSNNRELDSAIYSIGSTAGGRDYLSPPASPNLSLRSRERDRVVFVSPVVSSSPTHSVQPRGSNITGCRNPSSPPPLQPPTSALSVSPPSPSPPPTGAASAMGPALLPQSHHHHHQHHHPQHQHHHHHPHPHHRRVEAVSTSSPTALRDRDFIGAQRNPNQPMSSSNNSSGCSSSSSNANGSTISSNSSTNNNTNCAAGREREYLSMRNSILGSPRFHRRNMPGRASGSLPFCMVCLSLQC